MHCIVLYCMKMSTYYNDFLCLQKKEVRKKTKIIKISKNRNSFFVAFFRFTLDMLKVFHIAQSGHVCVCVLQFVAVVSRFD